MGFVVSSNVTSATDNSGVYCVGQGSKVERNPQSRLNPGFIEICRDMRVGIRVRVEVANVKNATLEIRRKHGSK
jgi:hypothetical protein